MMIPQSSPDKREKIKEFLLRTFKDLIGIVIIGSYAEGSATAGSDIDIVIVKRRRLSVKKRLELERTMGERVQIISFNRREVEYHFHNATTMAHSIRNGLVLYDRTGLITRLSRQSLGLPNREWMRQWFIHWLRFYRLGVLDRMRQKRFHKRYCLRRCRCQIGDHLARATVNFAILFLETKGIVPTTKKKIKTYIRRFLPRDLMRGLLTAFKVYHKTRNLRASEADEVFRTASWLRRRLKRALTPEEEGDDRP